MNTISARIAEIFPSLAARIWLAILLAAFLVTGGVVAANAAGTGPDAAPEAPAHSQLLQKGQTSQADQESAKQIEAILGL